MTLIPNALSLLRSQSISPRVFSLLPFPPSSSASYAKAWSPTNLRVFWFDSCRLRWTRRRSSWGFRARASRDSYDSKGERNGDGTRPLQGMIDALPPAIVVVKRNIGSKFAIGLYTVFAFLAIVVRQIMLKKHSHNHQGSVADLVKRGQLRSDRGISKPLKYEDPFNNPLVKVGKSDSTIEICGKVYRLAPVTLTEEQQSVHQKRRSRAYQWKRPTVFLKEGDSMPADVDPDTVRWIPANHPFATTVSDIDEDMAQDNVFQKHGVPSRVKAEHEALQKKLEALQSEQQLNEIVINPKGIRDLERPVKSSSKPHEQHELRPSADQQYGHIISKPDPEVGSSENKTLPDELRKKF